MYVTVTSRPDLCMAVNYFSGFQSCATDEHYSHLKRVLRYIQGTLDLKLIYRRCSNAELLEGFADADWAGDVVDRKSLSGYVFKLNAATVSWSTRKQVSVALSSAEAEYASLTMAVTEAIWLRVLLRDLGQHVEDPTVIHEDNQACIHVAESDKPTRRMKHVDVRFHFVKNEIDAGTIRLLYIPSEDQIADVPTNNFN
ncbi:uncharacterized protein LOC134221576 [Armigeres subalbatus]|uniref:uncharacterized protein LOC134221576 n=1 Tax=Armigeres subalbatus TaxID=124917 RepID=UPI002ED5B3FC